MNVPCCCQSNVRSVFLNEAFGRRKDEKVKTRPDNAVEERELID